MGRKGYRTIEWISITTITKLPVNESSVPILNRFKKYLVCSDSEGDHQTLATRNS